jgi:hypothetical protein
MRDMQEQPAGWYRDTERPNLHRYWTGRHWSDWLGEELAVKDRARVPEQTRRDHEYDARACG